MSDSDRTHPTDGTETDDNSDAPAARTAGADTDGGTSTASSRGRAVGPRDDTNGVRTLILRGALVVLGFVAVVALFQFYTSAVAVINEWVGREYRALFRAAFNLVVLLAAGIGISVVVRELTGTGGDEL